MNYKQLQRRVEIAERRVESRSQQTVEHWSELKLNWREGWTPARIIAAGLVSGFVSGRAEPLRALTGPRMLQMIGAISGLFASAQASMAAGQAEKAADTAQDVAVDVAADQTAGQAPTTQTAQPSWVPEQRRPEQTFATEPRPAEAATEISEP